MTTEGQNTPVSTPSGPSAEGQDATQETQDATEAAQRRVERGHGTSGNRRGPSGYLCCQHCVEDNVHDVETDGHDVPCQSCDTPATLLRERAEAAEARVAEKDATIAELRAEVERLTRLLNLREAQSYRNRAEAAEAEVERLRKPTVAAVMGYELGAGDLEHAEARVAGLEATVAKVREAAGLLADAVTSSRLRVSRSVQVAVSDLRAILDAPKDSGATS